jgi:hypothetical protein
MMGVPMMKRLLSRIVFAISVVLLALTTVSVFDNRLVVYTSSVVLPASVCVWPDRTVVWVEWNSTGPLPTQFWMNHSFQKWNFDQMGLFVEKMYTVAPQPVGEFWHVRFPAWCLLFLWSIAPSIWLYKFVRRKCRLRKLSRIGLCPVCGYDLRAHQPGQRCPECGTIWQGEATATRMEGRRA